MPEWMYRLPLPLKSWRTKSSLLTMQVLVRPKKTNILCHSRHDHKTVEELMTISINIKCTGGQSFGVSKRIDTCSRNVKPTLQKNKI